MKVKFITIWTEQLGMCETSSKSSAVNSLTKTFAWHICSPISSSKVGYMNTMVISSARRRGRVNIPVKAVA